MASILLLVICLLLGTLVTRFGRPPEGLARSLNWWVLYVALPAMVLVVIPQIKPDSALWFLPTSMWLIFIGSWLMFHNLGTRLGWPRPTIGAVVLAGGLCNSSFVGFPIIEALLGKQALTYAAIADQLGSFMNVSIGGTMVVAMYSGGRVDGAMMLRKIIAFPPFIALLIAAAVALTPGWPEVIETSLSRISATMSPLALFSVGLQLRFNLSKQRTLPLVTGLGWKLGVAPLIIMTVGTLLHINASIHSVALLEAGMAPMVTVAILAEQGNLDSPLANTMVGFGILASFITVPLWNLML